MQQRFGPNRTFFRLNYTNLYYNGKQLVKGNWTPIQNVKNSRRQVSTEVTSTRKFHLLRLRCVGEVSELALKRKES